MPKMARLARVCMATWLLATAVVSASSSVAKAERFDAVLERWAQSLETQAALIETDPNVREPVSRVGQGPGIRPGHSGERVWRMSHRLMELGLLEQGELSQEYAGRLVEAVQIFQASKGLKADGVVGSGTVAALDASPRAGAVSMRESAAQFRALQNEHIRDGLFVNLPSQTVTLVRGGEYILSMRAIVGRPSRETPLLNDKITHVIVNPTWTVPPTVMKEDKLPNLKKTGKVGVSNAVVYLDGEEIDPTIVDWSEITPNRVRIVQTPGNHNALGRFRFNLTNAQSIYLHGTNEPHLFDRDIRTISSGCVRLHDARKLAEILLADNNVGVEQIDRLMATMTPQWIKLNRSLPVRFAYWLATVTDDGKVRVHPDVYERAEPPTQGVQAQKTPAGGRQG
jgi:L,D-transpeptidase YcbB